MTNKINQNISETKLKILFSVSFCHFINDTIQSLILAIYPILKSSLDLSFAQIGLITLVFQLTASILQPVVGIYTDKKPQPYSLVVGMICTFTGLLLLAIANSFITVLLSVAVIGSGSSIFHPESSRIARAASGGKHGFAQSIFQVGGNSGTAIGPLLAAFIIIPNGQSSVAWFSLLALVGMIILSYVGRWYKNAHLGPKMGIKHSHKIHHHLSNKKVRASIVVLIILIFSKYFYSVSISSYFIFYLIHAFGISIQEAQFYLFAFLAASAIGTLLGGVVGDRFGRKLVIWISILGTLPFSLILPYANLFWTGVLVVIIGLIISSAFSAILVYAQELIPGKIGTISGLFFGLAFGMAGLSAAALGKLIDITDIEFVYKLCSIFPAIGLFTWFLPNIEKHKK
jgi:FSR family fosmidomycin resistance protein-like MFS transporter